MFTMNTFPNPSAATFRCIDGAIDPRIHAAHRQQIPLPPSPPAGTKRRARSAFIEAIAELMGAPEPASHGQEIPDRGAP